MKQLTVKDPRVAAAVALVDRRDFLQDDVKTLATRDSPIGIGFGQTTSQPSLIAWMLDELRIRPGQKVLEVGTGCGYQTALLSQLGARVFSVEIVAPLAAQARATLEELGAPNIQLRVGDGYQGWPEEAPFDAIIVAAGAPKVPAPLIEQLKPGARLIIPVGAGDQMDLLLITRDAAGAVTATPLFPVRFVPLTGAAAEADRAPASPA